ncbi:MAG: glycoside hydrolase family 99-like domain-containing protein [Actinobacteria bacterium]|nr:glycoside hydrolase family 99-like domain-containing protein [Actinomycetota bacterium]
MSVSTDEEVKVYEEELNRANSELMDINSKISDLSARIDAVTKELTRLEADLQQIEDEFGRTSKIYNQRIVLMYKFSRAGLFSSVFDAEGFNQFYDRLKMFYLLSTMDVRAFEELRDVRDRLENKKKEYEDMNLSLLAEKNRLGDLIGIASAKKNEIQDIYYEKGGVIQQFCNVDTTSYGWGESFADISDWQQTQNFSTDGDIASITGSKGSVLTQSISLGKAFPLDAYPYLTINIKVAKGNTYHIRPIGVNSAGASVDIWFPTSPSSNRQGTDRWETVTWNLAKMSRGGAYAFSGLTIIVEGTDAPVSVSIDWMRLHSGIVPNEPFAAEKSFQNQVDEDGDGRTDRDDNDYVAPKLVLAFYHNWYGSRYGPTGYWFHWNLNGHNPDNERSGRREIASPHYPSLSPEKYDSQDPDVLYTHVKQAISAGIDGFVVDWWGINHFEDVSFRLLLGVVEKNFPNFKLAILYDGHYAKDYKNGAGMGAEFKYILNSYSNSPNYLKFEGRPVIMIWNAKSHKSSEWVDAYYSVADRGNVVFLTDWWNYTSFSDGYTTYTNDSNGYLLNIDPTKIVSETVMPGWDNTKVVKNGVVIPRGSGGFYAQWWGKVYKNAPDFVVIASWNEWHEGSEIEPSLEYGDTYLNLTREYASKYKGN